MDYSLKLFIVMMTMVVAAAMMFMTIRKDETYSDKRMRKIPVRIDDGRKRGAQQLPPEEEQSDNRPLALYLGFLLFVYFLFLFLRFA